MGTSSSRSAPRGGGWTKAKGAASRFASGAALASDVASAYVEALGGSSKASRGTGGGGGGGGTRGAFSSAKKTARSLGLFLGRVASQGLDQTLRDFGLGDLVGRSASEVISGIVDALVGPGASLDEAVARVALVEVMGELYDEGNIAYESLIDSWETGVDRDRCVELFELFLVEAIYQKMLSDLADRIEEHSDSVAMTRARELELRDYIKEMVRFDLRQNDPLQIDWQGQEGEELIVRNLETVLAQLEE
jgi:hypothetical protein